MPKTEYISVSQWARPLGLAPRSGSAWLYAKKLPAKYKQVIAGRLCIRADAPAPVRNPRGRPPLQK